MDSMSSTVDLKDGSLSGEPPTVAAFTPASSSTATSPYLRNTIIVHQKSPLLVATPPQITRALAYSHIFIVPLNKLAGLVSWSTGDPWESFLLLASFCAATLYGDILVRWTGPLLVVAVLILGLYARRYSPLSSDGWVDERGHKSHQRKDSDGKTRHHKSLDEIVDTLKMFTARCNILLEPFLYLTDFLSTQSTATSATTRPALTTLFIRILLLSPAWFLLSVPFIHIITTQRVVLIFGIIGLSYHSRPARITRTILWRSMTVRRTCSAITGLKFSSDFTTTSSLQFPKSKDGRIARGASSIAALLAASRKRKTASKDTQTGAKSESIRFTFTLYENQRRWIGIGWTTSMLAYERAAWTDEQLEAAPSKDRFELPEIEGGFAKWQWSEGSQWYVETIDEDVTESDNIKVTATPSGSRMAKDAKGKESVTNTATDWVYYDTKWRFGRRHDGWGRYTRRRKWCRDAELVEILPVIGVQSAVSDSPHASSSSPSHTPPTERRHKPTLSASDTFTTSPTSAAAAAAARKRPWFGTGTRTNSKSDVNAHSRTTNVAAAAAAAAGGTDKKTVHPSSSLGTEGDGTDNESIGSKNFGSNSGGGGGGGGGGGRDDSDDDDGYVPMAHRVRGGILEAAWGFGEDVGMELG